MVCLFEAWNVIMFEAGLLTLLVCSFMCSLDILIQTYFNFDFSVFVSFSFSFCFHFIFAQIRANTSQNIHHSWNAIMINAPSINCASISIVWIYCAWMSIKCYANEKKCCGIWNGIKSAMRVWPMAFCGSHQRTIVRFNSANANTMANKRIIIACKAIAIRSILAPAMCKCIQIIIARIRLSCKKGEFLFAIMFIISTF